MEQPTQAVNLWDEEDKRGTSKHLVWDDVQEIMGIDILDHESTAPASFVKDEQRTFVEPHQTATVAQTQTNLPVFHPNQAVPLFYQAAPHPLSTTGPVPQFSYPIAYHVPLDRINVQSFSLLPPAATTCSTAGFSTSTPTTVMIAPSQPPQTLPPSILLYSLAQPLPPQNIPTMPSNYAFPSYPTEAPSSLSLSQYQQHQNLVASNEKKPILNLSTDLRHSPEKVPFSPTEDGSRFSPVSVKQEAQDQDDDEKSRLPLSDAAKLFNSPGSSAKWICPQCQKDFLTRKNLNTHLAKSHTEDSATSCPHCHKLYTATEALIKHINRKHSSAKLFQCNSEGCNKTFLTKKEQQNHIARHSKEKKFKCPARDCTCSYTTKASLDLHRTRIHGDKRYKCTICDESYAVRGDLNQHIKRKHTSPPTSTHSSSTAQE